MNPPVREKIVDPISHLQLLKGVNRDVSLTALWSMLINVARQALLSEEMEYPVRERNIRARVK